MALILSEHSIASLSTRLLSSTFEFRADRIMHISHMLILHALKLARFSGDPCNVTRNDDEITLEKPWQKKIRLILQQTGILIYENAEKTELDQSIGQSFIL